MPARTSSPEIHSRFSRPTARRTAFSSLGSSLGAQPLHGLLAEERLLHPVVRPLPDPGDAARAVGQLALHREVLAVEGGLLGPAHHPFLAREVADDLLVLVHHAVAVAPPRSRWRRAAGPRRCGGKAPPPGGSLHVDAQRQLQGRVEVHQAAEFTSRSRPARRARSASDRPSRGSETSPASGTHFSRRKASKRSPWRLRSGSNGRLDATLPKKRASAVPPVPGRTSTKTLPTSG